MPAKKAIRTGAGITAGSRTGSRATETPRRIRYAANHGAAARVPANMSAPSGAVRAHNATPLDATNPPSDHWSAKGSASSNASWTERNTRYRLVRANTASETSEMRT